MSTHGSGVVHEERLRVVVVQLQDLGDGGLAGELLNLLGLLKDEELRKMLPTCTK